MRRCRPTSIRNDVIQMQSRMSYCLLALGCLVALPVWGEDGPRELEDVYKLLLERKIPIDVEKVRRAAVEGVIKAVDPGAVLLSAEEFHKALLAKSLVKSEEWPEGICYLRLKGLYRDGGDEVSDRIRKWQEAGKIGVILDLRGADGNSLASVDRIAELFARGNPLLYQLKDGREPELESHRAKTGADLPKTPFTVIVVVDGKTSDSGELLAAALKNRPGVLVLGSKTHGDGGYREYVRLSQDEILHIVTKRVILGGVQIDSNGVLPDVDIEAAEAAKLKTLAKGLSDKVPSDKTRVDRELMEKVYADPALLRATDILLGLKATAYGNETAIVVQGPPGEH